MKPYIVIILIVVAVLIWIFMANKVENFHTYFGYFKNHCESCNWRSPESCYKCTNCGLCEKEDGTVICTEGSSDGPFFSNDCVRYIYGSSQFYYPYSYIYPISKTKTFFPKNEPSIRHQYKWVNHLPNN